jgi:hypothetical protein
MHRSIYLLGSLLWVLSGCSHAYYTPNSLYLPLLESKHDVSLDGALVVGGGQSGYELKASYRPLSHVALMVNHFNISAGAMVSVFDEAQSGLTRITEAGLGYYDARSHHIFSLFGGYGGGFSQHKLNADAEVNLSLRRFFLQPGYMWKNEYFNIGAGLKLIRLDYPKGNVDLRLTSSFLGSSELTAIRNIDKESPFWFVEAGGQLGIRYGAGTMGLFGNILLKRDLVRYHFHGAIIGAQFGVNLHTLFAKKTKK